MESMQEKFISECTKLGLQKMAKNIFKKNLYKIVIIKGIRRQVKIGFREFLFFKRNYKIKEYRLYDKNNRLFSQEVRNFKKPYPDWNIDLSKMFC